MMSVTNENQRLQKTIETCNKKLEELGHENQDIESENHKLQKTVETLKLSTRRYNDLERDITELEANSDKLTRENRCLAKETARLKQAIEVCVFSMETCSAYSALELKCYFLNS